MGVIDRGRAWVRAQLGITDPELPQIDLLARYEAEVIEQSADGKTLKLKILDKRFRDFQDVPLRAGIAAADVRFAAGAKVLIGWLAGDPKQAFAEPQWAPGATVTKLVLPATIVHLGAESGSNFIARADLVQARFNQIYNAVNNALTDSDGAIQKTSLLTALSGLASSVATTQTKAK